MNNRNFAILSVLASALVLSTIAAIPMAPEDALAYEKNQATSQTSDCGNEFIPINIGCQNTDSEIQGDENAAALTAQQTFPEEVEPSPMAATLQVCKDTASDGGRYQFSITGNSPSPMHFSLMPGDCQAVTINPGHYAVTENFHGAASVGLDSHCTLTNDDLPTASGNIQAGGIQSCSFFNEIEYVFLTKWGSIGVGDGRFRSPFGIAVDSSTGNVFVADTLNHRIQVFDSGGTFITKWGSSGAGDGQFDQPEGIAVDPSTGNVFVADTFNNRIQVFEFDGSTATFIREWGSFGTGDGEFELPVGIAVDPLTGNVFVADTDNNRIQVFEFDGSTATFIREWGSFGTGDGEFNEPYGIAVDPSTGNVFVADTFNNRIQLFDSNGNLITKWGTFGTGDGDFNNPYGIAVDPSTGNIFVADANNNRIQLFALT